MAARRITLQPSVPHTRQRVTLDGREYVLVLRWSQREERWYMDLHDGNEVLLIGCIKIVVSWPLLYRFRTIVGMPPGDLVVVDGRTPLRDPGFADLGDVAQLVYLDAAELAATAPSSSALPVAPSDSG